jgi:hypothetical protein
MAAGVSEPEIRFQLQVSQTAAEAKMKVSVSSEPPMYPTSEPGVVVEKRKIRTSLAESCISSRVRLPLAAIPKNSVNGPTLGTNPAAVTSAETNPLLAAPLLLSIIMSPPRVHVGEQTAERGNIVAETSRVMTPARAAPPLITNAMAIAPARSNAVGFIVSPL